MKIIDLIRQAARDVPAYVTIRRWQREGFLKAFRRHRLWSKILESPPIRTESRSRDSAEVHIVCHQRDYLSAMWTLKTFYLNAQVNYPLVIHINGETRSDIFDRMHAHFPEATLVDSATANALVERCLSERGLTRLICARRSSPFMVKLTDFSLLAEGTIVVGMDSDVLFFSDPLEITERCKIPIDRYLFQQDPKNNYNISEEDALREFGIHLAPKVNTGFLVYLRNRPDMAAFDRYLAHPGVARANGFIEQTLYALHASELGLVDYLPEKYFLGLDAGLSYDEMTARHYAGPSRRLLTDEGMPRVLMSGVLMDDKRET